MSEIILIIIFGILLYSVWFTSTRQIKVVKKSKRAKKPQTIVRIIDGVEYTPVVKKTKQRGKKW